MKKMLIGLVGVTVLSAAALGQPGTLKIYTCPKLPTTEALERLSLKMAWSARLKLRGQRDGLVSIQLIPGVDPSEDNPQLLVQSYSGLVALFDAETGDRLWQTQVSTPFWASQPAGIHPEVIFVTRRNYLHILSRATGEERLYTEDKVTGVRTYGIELPYTPTAAPVVNGTQIYFVMSNRVLAYELGKLEVAWSYLIGEEFVEFPALVSNTQLTVATSANSTMSLNKFKKEKDEPQLRYAFVTDGNIVAAPGQLRSMMYVGTDNATLYAINMESAKLAWRFLPGGAIRKSPAVTDRDVFVAGDQLGMYRVRRDTGREVWFARQLDRFLSANENFVYALHTSGEMHVLDYLRGTTLARYDVKDWVLPVANELTDRIYLAANDGQIICLRHRDLKTPLFNRVTVPAPKEEKKEEKKEDMPEDKKEEKKEDKKIDKKDEKKDDKGDKKDEKKIDKKDDKGDKKDDKGNAFDGSEIRKNSAGVGILANFATPQLGRGAIRQNSEGDNPRAGAIESPCLRVSVSPCLFARTDPPVEMRRRWALL